MEANDVRLAEEEFKVAPRKELEVELDRVLVHSDVIDDALTIARYSATVHTLAWAPLADSSDWRLQVRTYDESGFIAGIEGMLQDRRNLVGTTLLAETAHRPHGETLAAVVRLSLRLPPRT